MAENSKIEWTDHTFSPWRGCAKVATGCENCYAEALSKRWGGRHGIWGKNGTRVIASDTYWRKPLKWARDARRAREHSIHKDGSRCAGRGEPPREDCRRAHPINFEAARPRVFCGSMCDVFEDRPDLVEPRARLFRLIDATPELDWLVLTKRPENIARLMAQADTPCAPSGEEEWRPIPGHAPYEASSHGRIRGPRGKPLAPDTNETGHQRVTLYGKRGRHREQLYRMVLLAFVGEPPSPSAQARHLDGDTSNNAPWNLAWGSQSRNWSDSKRHGTHRRYSKLTEDDVRAIRARRRAGDTYAIIAQEYGVSDTQAANICSGRQWSTDQVRPNLWLGVSVACQEDADRNIPELLKVPAAVRFVSYEPAVGPVDFSQWLWGRATPCADCPKDADCPCGFEPRSKLEGENSLAWIIVGGESGPGARPFDVQWARDTIRQCRDAGVACFVKQVGAHILDRNDAGFMGEPEDAWDIPDIDDIQHLPDDTGYQGAPVRVRLQDPKGADMTEWPEDLRVREFPR